MGVEQFVGTWRLVSLEGHYGDGTVAHPFGPDAAGIIVYDAQGHMAAQIMRRDRPRFAAGDQQRGTPEENRAAVTGYVAYWGSYELFEDGTIVHHVQGSLFPNWVGGEQRRFWEFVGSRLVLRTPPTAMGGRMVSSVLVWERVA